MSRYLDAGSLAYASRLSHQSPLAIHYAKCPPGSDFSATSRGAVTGEVTARGLVVERVTALAHSAVGARLAAMLDADEAGRLHGAVWTCRLSRQMP